MHLALRSYVLVMLTAVLAVSGTWAQDPQLMHLWQLPAGILLLGLAAERVLVRRLVPRLHLETATPAYLGRPQPGEFVFANGSARALDLQYIPVAPEGFESLGDLRAVHVPPRAEARDALSLSPVRLGPQRWPSVPGRILGPLSLAWWNVSFEPRRELTVAPDILRDAARMRGFGEGARARRTLGPGQELHQLRGYQRGDPLSRIDWKATARTGSLVTREFSEDQHLDVLLAIDAGRLSRVRCGRLDRLGLYSNVAASFAELVVHNDDRVGVVVYADRVLASSAPARGMPAVVRLRGLLEHLAVRPAESAPTAAAVTMRRLLRQRALIIVLTDLDDVNVAESLARAVRLLSPPHLVLVAGVHSAEIGELARAPASEWQDPWVALAAQEQERRAAAQRALLERLGAPVVAATPARLKQVLYERYEALRRSRRV